MCHKFAMNKAMVSQHKSSQAIAAFVDAVSYNLGTWFKHNFQYP